MRRNRDRGSYPSRRAQSGVGDTPERQAPASSQLKDYHPKRIARGFNRGATRPPVRQVRLAYIQTTIALITRSAISVPSAMRTSICSSEISFVCEKRAEGDRPPRRATRLRTRPSWWKRLATLSSPKQTGGASCLRPRPGGSRGDSAGVTKLGRMTCWTSPRDTSEISDAQN